MHRGLASPNSWLTAVLRAAALCGVFVLNSSRGQILNGSLIHASKCDVGLLQDIDKIFILAKVDTQGHSKASTIFTLDVEATTNNRSFTQVCKVQFRSSDCTTASESHCYCFFASADKQVLDLVLKKMAAASDSDVLYRFKLTWEGGFSREIHLRIPTVYGEPESFLKLGNGNETLADDIPCNLPANDNASFTGDLTFCTYNLSIPVLTVGFGTGGVHYFVNENCGTILGVKSKTGSVINLSYGDSCRRYQTFQCTVADLSEKKNSISLLRNNLLLYSACTLLGLILLINVVASMLGGANRDSLTIDDKEAHIWMKERVGKERALRLAASSVHFGGPQKIPTSKAL